MTLFLGSSGVCIWYWNDKTAIKISRLCNRFNHDDFLYGRWTGSTFFKLSNYFFDTFGIIFWICSQTFYILAVSVYVLVEVFFLPISGLPHYQQRNCFRRYRGFWIHTKTGIWRTNNSIQWARWGFLHSPLFFNNVSIIFSSPLFMKLRFLFMKP